MLINHHNSNNPDSSAAKGHDMRIVATYRGLVERRSSETSAESQVIPKNEPLSSDPAARGRRFFELSRPPPLTGKTRSGTSAALTPPFGAAPPLVDSP